MRIRERLAALLERITGRQRAQERDIRIDAASQANARLAAILEWTDWEIERIRRNAQR